MPRSSFWQLSGPDSHFARTWVTADSNGFVGNAKISSQLFHLMSRKLENGEEVIDLILGIEPSGASHILLPETSRIYIRGLTWRNKNPYSASKFASLSPIQVGRDAFRTMLEDRQVTAKSTTASKKTGDNSKANRAFWDGAPRPARAAFEHGRCFWRIMHKELDPHVYGIFDAPWSKGVDIISLAMKLWSADDKTFLDAGLTCIHLSSGSGSTQAEKTTWYFKSKDCDILLNSSRKIGANVPESWNTTEVGNDAETEVGKEIQRILGAHSHPRRFPLAPLVLLVHDFATVRVPLESWGIQMSRWKSDLKELLGYHVLEQTKLGESASDGQNSRARSKSPSREASSKGLYSRQTRSPEPARTYAPVYVVDTLMMFKTVTGSGNHPSSIRPVDVYNIITRNNQSDPLCSGDDSNYIMSSWEAMVASPSLDEQKAIYMRPSVNATDPQPMTMKWHQGEKHHDLFNEEKHHDLFNDASDSEDDY